MSNSPSPSAANGNDFVELKFHRCTLVRVQQSKDGKRQYATVQVGMARLEFSADTADFSAIPQGITISLQVLTRPMDFGRGVVFVVVDDRLRAEPIAPPGFKLVAEKAS